MKTCKNCKYSEPIGGGLACMGQKGMPFVRPTESCGDWKSTKQTNADRIRAGTDEEIAVAILKHKCESCDWVGFCKTWDECKVDLVKWLKQEVTP